MSAREENSNDQAASWTRNLTEHAGPKVRVSGLIRHRGTVLLVRQTRRSHDHWLLPGGAVERGETLTEALEREVHEECGLRVEVENVPIALVQTISPDRGKTRHLIQVIFEASPAVSEVGLLKEPPRLESGDPAIKELHWFARQDIVNLDVHPPIHQLLISWLRLRDWNPTALIPFVCTEPLWAEE